MLFLNAKHTLPETNSSHLKMDGWKTTFLLGWPILRGELLVSGSVTMDKEGLEDEFIFFVEPRKRPCKYYVTCVRTHSCHRSILDDWQILNQPVLFGTTFLHLVKGKTLPKFHTIKQKIGDIIRNQSPTCDYSASASLQASKHLLCEIIHTDTPPSFSFNKKHMGKKRFILLFWEWVIAV